MDLAEFYLDKHNLITELDGETYYMCIFPEMLPCFPTGVKPTGGYGVYCVHPQYGSCYFSISQDEECSWLCEHRPPFIKKELVAWIGEQIEAKANR